MLVLYLLVLRLQNLPRVSLVCQPVSTPLQYTMARMKPRSREEQATVSRKSPALVHGRVRKTSRTRRTFLEFPGEIRNRVYEELEHLATEGTTDPENLVSDPSNRLKVTRDPRAYLLSLSMACRQLRFEVKPLHVKYRDRAPMRIRLDDMPAYDEVLRGGRQLASDFVFGDRHSFELDIGFFQNTTEVDILPFLRWYHESADEWVLDFTDEQDSIAAVLQVITEGTIQDTWLTTIADYRVKAIVVKMQDRDVEVVVDYMLMSSEAFHQNPQNVLYELDLDLDLEDIDGWDAWIKHTT